MNIMYTITGSYAPQAAAAVTSVCESNRNVPDLHFYMLYMDMKVEERERFQNYVRENYHRKVTFLSIDDLGSNFSFTIDTTGWNPIVLARLVLDHYLPESVHRVLYLDGDTIVRGNLSKLWETDMGDCVIGACMEPTCSRERKDAMGLKHRPYFNAGVLLINLDLWKTEKTGEEILRYYTKHNGRLFANDQDAINGSQKGRIYELPFTYNYANTYDIYRYRLLEKNCDYPIPSRETVRKIRKNPCIIHYLGEERPWRIGNHHRFRDDYLRNLDKTPWRGQNLEDGWKFYFLCWDIFNFVMKPFPMTRLSIINSLIPMVLQRRSKKK